MTKYSLAVDIGASSGRVMLGFEADGKLKLEELHRFGNGLVKRGKNDCWDLDCLFKEIKIGIHKCQEKGIQPDSIGIDTWAVDFVLLDENEELLTEAVAYRDSRTEGMIDHVFQKISKERLYLETGIQFLSFNTIYQLMAFKKSHPEVLEKAKTFLMVPDYLNFLLTGIKANEYTNATTTQLVNAFTKHWDKDLLKLLGFNETIFQKIKLPKTILGTLRDELVDEFGFDMKVVLPATHDTASAVVSVPEQEDTIYISSGTWSLIGVENHFPICVTKALDYNFTNEGGLDYRFRFLKNIMGLWMFQEVRRNLNHAYSFAELVELAKEAKHFHSIINVDEDRFLNPENMITEIQRYCEEQGLMVPSTPGELAKCIFDSLVVSYQKAIVEIEEIFEKTFEKINVIGGGCQNVFLNQLIANATDKKVLAGPVEATAIGNVVAQFMALGVLEDLNESRQLIKDSFPIKKYEKVTSL
jgi:rhamnulokinase